MFIRERTKAPGSPTLHCCSSYIASYCMCICTDGIVPSPLLFLSFLTKTQAMFSIAFCVKALPGFLASLLLFDKLKSLKSTNALYEMGWQTLYTLYTIQKRLYLYTCISREALFLLFFSSSQSLGTLTSWLFEHSYPMVMDDRNDIQVHCGHESSPFCKSTTKTLYFSA